MIFIPGNVPSSKNSRVWTGKFFIASKAVASWRKETKDHWESNRDVFLSMIKGKEFPIRVEFTFVRKSKHQFDYLNPCQSIQDEMVKYGWIEDDNADIIIPVFMQYIYDKLNPGCYINVQ